jgi:hypothetical protein
MSCWEDRSIRAFVYEVECHDARERAVLTYEDLAQAGASEIAIGVAFAAPKKLPA